MRLHVAGGIMAKDVDDAIGKARAYLTCNKNDAIGSDDLDAHVADPDDEEDWRGRKLHKVSGTVAISDEYLVGRLSSEELLALVGYEGDVDDAFLAEIEDSRVVFQGRCIVKADSKRPVEGETINRVTAALPYVPNVWVWQVSKGAQVVRQGDEKYGTEDDHLIRKYKGHWKASLNVSEVVELLDGDIIEVVVPARGDWVIDVKDRIEGTDEVERDVKERRESFKERMGEVLDDDEDEGWF